MGEGLQAGMLLIVDYPINEGYRLSEKATRRMPKKKLAFKTVFDKS